MDMGAFELFARVDRKMKSFDVFFSKMSSKVNMLKAASCNTTEKGQNNILPHACTEMERKLGPSLSFMES